jgi:hypothetical protein
MIDDLDVVEVVTSGEVIQVVDRQLLLKGAAGVVECLRIHGNESVRFLLDSVCDPRAYGARHFLTR